MVLAFVLGLMGSLGHCVGMCGGVVVLLSRRGVTSGGRLWLAHLGRITTYGLLGLGAGVLGQVLGLAFPGLRQLQGALALAVAGVAVYLALALVGRAPSPEIYLAGLTRRWGRAMQRLTALGSQQPAVVLGLLWGLLPCGLVLTALLTAAVAGSPWRGALTMLAFGLGTLPALLGVGWVSRRGLPQAVPWPRQVAALAVLLFGTQMALRGLAAWGWVGHFRMGGLMLW
jgi:hypothetical protein